MFHLINIPPISSPSFGRAVLINVAMFYRFSDIAAKYSISKNHRLTESLAQCKVSKVPNFIVFLQIIFIFYGWS